MCLLNKHTQLEHLEPLVRQQAPLAFKGFGPRTITPSALAGAILILAEQPNCSMLG